MVVLWDLAEMLSASKSYLLLEAFFKVNLRIDLWWDWISKLLGS